MNNILNSKFSFVSNNSLTDGEERLGQVYNAKVTQGCRPVVIGLDGGSTQTRAKVMGIGDDESALEDLYVIPSNHSATTLADTVLPKSEELYDIMDSTITNSIEAPNNIFDKFRVLRGTKYVDANMQSSRINSSIQKIDTPAFYLNVIDCIGYSLVMKYQDTLVSTYDVQLCCTLPPDDILSEINRETFKKRLIGTFIWSNKELGVTLNINIKNLALLTEAEAPIKAHLAQSGEEYPEYAMIVEGGGRSIGTGVLHNGKHIDTAGKTFTYGGTQLKTDLNEIYRRTNGGRNLQESQLNNCLARGVLKSGRSYIDMVNYIVEAKDKMAATIFSDIVTSVFDQQKYFAPEDIEVVFFSGKLFRGGEFEKVEGEEEGLTTYSIATPLATKLRTVMPNAEFIVLNENLIPLGALLMAYSEFGDALVEEIEEDEVAVAEEVTEELEEIEIPEDSQE